MSDKISIVRAPRDGENPYCMIRRATLQDDSLSYEARGVLAYLLSKPRNWRVVIADLMRGGSVGRDKVYRILRELEARRYVERHPIRKDGKWAGFEYYVFETPLPEKPDTEKPYTGKPRPVKPDTLQNGDSPQNTEATEDRAAAALPARPNVFAVWEGNIGMLTPIIADQLKAAAVDFPPGWLELAIREAALNNGKSWKYVAAILNRWQRDGLPAQHSAAAREPSRPAFVSQLDKSEPALPIPGSGKVPAP